MQVHLDHLAVVFQREGVGDHRLQRNLLLLDEIYGYLEDMLSFAAQIGIPEAVDTFYGLEFKPKRGEVNLYFLAYPPPRSAPRLSSALS